MSKPIEPGANACIVKGVQPLLTELREPIKAHYRNQYDDNRGELEDFIHRTFQQAYGAELRAFYPNLAAFTGGGQIRGVVGYRDGMVKPLFSEQYLDQPVEEVIAACLNQGIDRRELVEVGNLALTSSGEARWIIAATTMFLHAAGYRWVLFTAVRSLFNAFRRLGLNPIEIATPDPRRLPDGGSQWGRYYEAGPVVYAGNIEAGYRKLNCHVSQHQPRLHALLQEVRLLGMSTQYGDMQANREAF